MSCPYHKLKEGLPALTKRIARLFVADNGYPVPHFVQYIDDKPDFRVVDPQKLLSCINRKLCWICGEPLGAVKAFVIGPMGYVNRISSDAHMHRDCAEWSMKGCPFLTNPNQKRREDEMTERGKEAVGGVLIEENPGVMCVYLTKSYSLKIVGNGMLFMLGDAQETSWWARGRAATADELQRSFAVGCVRATAQCAELEREDFTKKVRCELEQIIKSYGDV